LRIVFHTEEFVWEQEPKIPRGKRGLRDRAQMGWKNLMVTAPA
jgi:hypothetical protein